MPLPCRLRGPEKPILLSLLFSLRKSKGCTCLSGLATGKKWLPEHALFLQIKISF